MPGETLSCVGCHEPPTDVTPSQVALAAVREVREVRPWRGPPRGFDFAREVQPVLNRHCVACHDGRSGRPDLRPEEQVPEYRGRRISKLGVDRMHPQMLADTGGVLKYAPAYDALIPYIRRVSIEDDVRMLTPGEYHADTSELIQLLRKGHQGVRLDAEAWDRLVTWIDLNGPCHGTWGDAYPIPDGAHQRRMELRRVYGGPPDDPEAIPAGEPYDATPTQPLPLPEPNPRCVGNETVPPPGRVDEKTVELAAGVSLKLVRIPAGAFVMGEVRGEPDEWPLTRVTIDQSFWMGACEVTNEQYRLFDPRHDSGYYQKRHARSDDEGLPLDEPQQPVVRVSWEQAIAFCRWLSQRTGLRFTLPMEAQWEYACRAGTVTPLHYGDPNTDFSAWANLGDLSFGNTEKGRYVGLTGGLEHVVLEGSGLSERRFDDGFVVTTPVGRLRPNAWGLCDMHGNAAEWTDTTYGTYGTDKTSGCSDESIRKVVRGGSFFDRPARARSAFRQAYPSWQRVFNVGFRVVCRDAVAGPQLASTTASSSR
jgi:formylglycine-generating enzyme required for sulfatase activity